MSDRIRIELPVSWVGAEEQPVLFANQFHYSGTESGEAFLTVGVALPPMVIAADPDERRRELEQYSFVPIQVLARFGLTKDRVKELHAMLERVINAETTEEEGK